MSVFSCYIHTFVMNITIEFDNLKCLKNFPVLGYK